MKRTIRTRWRLQIATASRTQRAATSTILSAFTLSIRKDRRWSMFRAPAAARSSSSAGQQKLLTPIVLGTGAISLNAADNDEKIEISKIVPSSFGDSDTKLTSHAGAAPRCYAAWPTWAPATPRSFRFSRRPSARRTLPGQLVVDAVPIANDSYLEAVLGKDITGKRDDAVKRTSGESSRSRPPAVLRSLRWR